MMPLSFSRFFVRGVFIPSTMLAFIAIREISAKYFTVQKNYVQNLLGIYLVLTASLTTVFIFYIRISEVKNNNSWYYMTKSQSNALEFIDQKLPEDSSILSLYYMGNQIPAHTSSRVFLGHKLQTPNFDKREAEAIDFYANNLSPNNALDFLHKSSIEYVYFGEQEKEASKKLRSNEGFTYDFLEQIFEDDGESIYKVL